MKKFYCFFFVFSAAAASAQKVLPDFGKIEMADLQLKSCSFEPDADAMKLFETQEIEFDLSQYASRLRTEKRVRIKIFNEKGYKYATIHIPYFSKKRVTKFKDLSGVIYSLDSSGKINIQKLEKKDFFKEKAEDKLGVINFTFPNVKSGSVIEFRFTKIEKDVLQIDPWIIQDEIPTAYAVTTLITPSFSRVKEKVFGEDSINQKVELKKQGYSSLSKRIYDKENIKSFRPEPFMSSYNDNLLKVVFLLIPESNFFLDILTSPQSVWSLAGHTLMKSPNFGGQIKKIIPGTETLIDSAKRISKIADRVRFIYEAVKQKIPDKAEQTLYPNDLTEAWTNKTGNTAEINLILLNLLKKAEVNCYPLLVSTREHGKVSTDFPSIGQLNGIDVLASDSGKIYLLDASLKFQSYQNPPFNILNRQAFLLGADTMQWVMIEDDRPLLRQNINVYAVMNEEGKIKGNAAIFNYDYAKSYILDSTLQDEEEKENKFFDKKPEGLKILSVKQENAEDDYNPLVEKVEFNYEPQQTDKFYFINPQFISFQKENPFILENRNSDIDFGCKQKLSLTLTLEIPPAYEIDHLPKSIIVRAPDTSFIFKRIISYDSEQILYSQTFEINQPIFYKEEYAAVQEFFKRAYALMAEEIILKKKK